MGNQESVNSVVDHVLDYVREGLLSSGSDTLPLPDIDESFKDKGRWYSVTVGVQCSEGSFEGVASLQRRKDVVFTQEPRRLTLRFTLGMDEAILRYDRYRLQVSKWGRANGTVTAKVRRNLFEGQVSVEVEEQEVTVELERAEFIELEDFDVHVTGLGQFNWLVSRVVSLIVNDSKSKIKRAASKAIYREFKKGLSKVNVRDLISKLA